MDNENGNRNTQTMKNVRKYSVFLAKLLGLISGYQQSPMMEVHDWNPGIMNKDFVVSQNLPPLQTKGPNVVQL